MPIKRPALRYYGGKWNQAPHIIKLFPPRHLWHVYGEPYSGGYSVGLQIEPPPKAQFYNDLDGNVVNYFRVLRDKRDELLDKIRCTPWAREEYLACQSVSEGNDVERARRFFVRSWMSFNGSVSSDKDTYGFRRRLRDSNVTRDLTHHDLFAISDRLQGVTIENLPAKQLIDDIDGPETLFYVDPPYPKHTRTKGLWYRHELKNKHHIQLARTLHRVEGYVVLSGYRCAMYDELYEGWERHDKDMNTNSGGKRTESVWLSPRTSEAVQRHKQLPLLKEM